MFCCIFVTSAFQTEGKLYLVLEFLRGGDLFTRLSKEVSTFSSWHASILPSMSNLHVKYMAHPALIGVLMGLMMGVNGLFDTLKTLQIYGSGSEER